MIRVEGVEPANHSCHVCGQWAPFGVGVSVRQGVEGKWCCRTHRPGDEPSPAPNAEIEAAPLVNAAPAPNDVAAPNAPNIADRAAPNAVTSAPAPNRRRQSGNCDPDKRRAYQRELMRRRRARAAIEAAA
jgi:hypothetical protein